jgi:hypothetical protein
VEQNATSLHYDIQFVLLVRRLLVGRHGQRTQKAQGAMFAY